MTIVVNANPYQTIGFGYSRHRRPDPRIADQTARPWNPPRR
ncbi:hypothetical protein EDD27_2320 [Nonomuraea polychroma]|uniref:Uncharacterized protein n=1 Tax=Nonomuraea polychroma TaxID=46176 RepID=A0A438M3A0_9ACTN|nr:hypothetical protein [Nonomuraea polychroma]RVX39943.1 hypothetical protein EDD27_2320 [Nonomuraea polychroma]